MIFTRVPPALLASADDLVLGLSPGTSHLHVSPATSCSGTFFSKNSLRLDVLAIAACGPAEPIGTLLARRRPTTNLASSARSRLLRRANVF